MRKYLCLELMCLNANTDIIQLQTTIKGAKRLPTQALPKIRIIMIMIIFLKYVFAKLFLKYIYI